VTTSGSLIVYNQYVAARAIVKIAAHSGDASTLDWHPTRPNMLATGGASDRSVKIWDLERELSVLHGGTTTSSTTPTHCNYSTKDDITSQMERNSSTGTSRGESVGTNESSTLPTGNDSSGYVFIQLSCPIL
jgi:WD40 repeat protein